MPLRILGHFPGLRMMPSDEIQKKINSNKIQLTYNIFFYHDILQCLLTLIFFVNFIFI